MKTCIKMIYIAVAFLVAFCSCQSNQSNTGDFGNAMTTDDSATEATTETESMGDRGKIEVLELTDNIKQSFEAMLDFGKDKTDGALKTYGCVRNATTAGEIAAAIFYDVFEEELHDLDFPLKVYYDAENNYWLVRTAPLPEGWRGGSKYIIINAMNAEVIGIWAFQ